MKKTQDKKHYDVIILGAGPAGTACALALKDANLSVALIDKANFPRDKICGDAIPGPTLKLIRKLVNDDESFSTITSKQQVTRSLIFPENGRTIDLNWKAEAYNAKRLDFDNFLFELVKEHTDTDLLIGKEIKRVEIKDFVHVYDKEDNEIASSQLILGADGANSIATRTFAKKQKAELLNGFAIRTYYSNVDCAPTTNEFYLLNKIQGYFWIFPLANNQYNVGIGFLKKQKRNSAFDVKQILQYTIQSHPTISPKFKNAKEISKPTGFKLPVGGTKRSFSGDRFLLLGDAAHLIDPLQGHGIDKAIESGILAAEQVVSCFEQNQFNAKFLRTYDAAIESNIEHSLRRNLRIMKILYRFPWVVRISASIVHFNSTFLLSVFYKK